MTDSAVGALDAQLRAHSPADAAERRSLARTRRYLAWLDRPLDEDADPVHVTGSAIVVDADGRIALHRHKRLGIWLQPGGHVDPGESVDDAALREAIEETGLALAHPRGGPTLVHVDVHQGPRGHVHLDVRYLVVPVAGGDFRPGDGESADVAWFAVDDAMALADANLRTAITTALELHGRPRTAGQPR